MSVTLVKPGEAATPPPPVIPPLTSGSAGDFDLPLPHRFTREEFHRLGDLGILATERRYELIDGIIFEKMGQKEPHPTIIMLWVFALARVFGEACIRCQAPVVLSDSTEPEPDLAVTDEPFRLQTGSRTTPTAAELRLVVEVSVSTATFDIRVKSTRYARSGVPEYWALDVEGRRLIVHRNPMPDGYASVTEFGPDATISPLAAPDAAFRVGDFLP